MRRSGRWKIGCLAIGLILSAAVSGKAADSWGDLKVRFAYEGDPPERKLIVITVDPQFCGKHGLREEQLVVHNEDHGIANVVVWLETGRAEPPVHPDYEKTANDTIPLDSTCCRVDPHVSKLRTSQTLLLKNTDPIGDGLKIDPFSNPGINLLLAENATSEHKFPKAERTPARVSCPVHPWESGWLVIKSHPYMAISDEHGRLELKNLPTGEWSFQVWHEKAGYVTEVEIEGKSTSWSRGRPMIEIKPGDNDLGEIVLRPSLFEK